MHVSDIEPDMHIGDYRYEKIQKGDKGIILECRRNTQPTELQYHWVLKLE